VHKKNIAIRKTKKKQKNKTIDYIFHALTLSMLRDRHFRVTRNKTLMACYLGIPGNVRHQRSHTV
jgi:hypothetical protein